MDDTRPGGSPVDLAPELAAVPAAARPAALRQFVADRPDTPVALSGANLNGADLGGDPPLRLSRAVLRGTGLRGAVLRGAVFERADLTNADLAGAALAGALLAGATLDGAMLEDADLADARLRFAGLRDAVLDGAKLPRADLWGVRAAGAVLAGADLRDASLEEADFTGADFTGADLRGAVLRKGKFAGANFAGANLEGAVLSGADLHGAVLRDARLQAVSLAGCRLSGVNFADAWLERTRMGREQLGDQVGEEAAGDFKLARQSYLALERNFESLGDPDAASWAYRKKRRMEKRDCRSHARRAWAAGHRLRAAVWAVRYANLTFVELLCDYGEGIPRVLASIFVLFLTFAVVYGATGSVTRTVPGEGTKAVTRHPLDLAMFSLLTMAQLDTGQAGLEPANEYVYLLSGIEALLTIFLTGLVGFVVGNRIRR